MLSLSRISRTGRALGALAILASLASLASACGGSSSGGSSAPSSGLTITLEDVKGRAIVGVTVLVSGRSAITDDKGVARIPLLPAIYDVEFLSPQDNAVYAFEGLTGASASLTVPFDFEPGWAAKASIITGSPGQAQLVTLATAADPAVDVAGANGDIELHWAAAGTATTVHVDAYLFDPASGTFTSRASADLTVHDADNEDWEPTWVDVAPGDSRTTAAQIQTADGSPGNVSAFFTDGVFALPHVTANAGTVNVPSSFVTPSMYLHAASILPGGAEVHLESAKIDAPLTLPAPIDLVSPDDGATVSATTTFATTGQGTMTVEMAPADAASSVAPHIFIVASKSPHMPDLAALGIRGLAGMKMMWGATEHPDDGVADVYTPYFANPARVSRRYARSPVRTVTLAGPPL